MELKEGYKNTEVGLIPEDWEVKYLGNLGDVRMCKRIFSYQTKDSGDIPFYKIGTFGKEPDAYISKEIYCEFRKKYSFPRIGSVLISAAGTIGKTIVYNGEDSYFQDSNIVWIENNNQVIPNEYLKHVFPIVKFRTEGGTIQRLYNDILKNGLFPLPPTLTEQKAIAQVLSDTDALIQAIEKKIAKRKLIKKGVMQKLLTPKKGWKEVELRKLLLEAPKYGIGAAAVELNSNFPTYLRITDIDEGGNLIKRCLKSVNHPDSENYILEEGEIVFARTGASVGKSYLYQKNDGKLVYAGFLIKIKPDSQKLSSKYLSKFVSTDKYWNWVIVNSMRSGQPGINGHEYGLMPILIPKTLSEQEQIAQILSDIDNEIEQLEQKLAKYKLVKQGMMQQLLTGKIRLVKPNSKANEEDLAMVAEPNAYYNYQAYGK